jgi:superfamily II DNA or RNA helicase
MDDLSELSLEPSYHKGADDIAKDFYLPCMGRATQYDRAVGFFSSSIYLLAWGSLKSFVKNGGQMRIICSPVLDSDDQDAMEMGYRARTEEDLSEDLQTVIDSMLDDASLEKPTKVLAALVAEGVVEFKIATFEEDSAPRHKRLFHDKLGIFSQPSSQGETGPAVAFKGSMNETWAGLAMDGNLESVDVYVSWGPDRERSRVRSEQDYFDSLWTDIYDTVHVKDFPSVAKESLVSAAEDVEWESLVDEIVEDIERSETLSPDSGPNPRTPLPHQRQALEAWRDRGYTGILKHATGSGKTFTALCAIREALKAGKFPVIFVPNTDILSQWAEELKSTNQDLEPEILICGGGRNEWRKDGLLRGWTRPDGTPRIVLTTMQTAITDDFQSLFQDGDHVFTIADEVHRIGSPEHSKILDFEAGWRLGLSATPRRYGDPDGTEHIMGFFDGIVQPPFTLKDAIEAGRLTPYFYHIHQVSLTPAEQDDWEELTQEIQTKYAQSQATDDEKLTDLPEYIKQLQIKRARILKKAQHKVEVARDVLSREYSEGDRWLVYCSDIDQLERVHDKLEELPFRVLEYHSKMDGNREQTLNYFRDNGGIILSIKCLDEGVDIPNATHALILASSKNPREFIQRRGRVLRKSDNKHHANVHDTIVMPYSTETEAPVTSILESELARAIKFGEDAENPKSVGDLKQIALDAGIDYEELADTGFEDD